MPIETYGYLVLRSDGETEVRILKGSAHFDQMSIPLIGENTTPYGDSAAQTWIHQLENFANNEAPINVIPGQLWYKKGISTDENDPNIALKEKSLYLMVSDGDEVNGFEPVWDQILTSSTANSDIDLGSRNNPWADTIYARHFFAVGGGTHGNDGPSSDGSDGQFVGTATQAKYADLAERFETDKVYEEGTIVKLGGEKEITQSTEEGDFDVFGVISLNPAFMMNAMAGNNETHPYVALQGRVPVKIKGQAKKGDRIIASKEFGIGRAILREELANFSPYQVIGRALEDKNNEDTSLLMVVVGIK